MSETLVESCDGGGSVVGLVEAVVVLEGLTGSCGGLGSDGVAGVVGLIRRGQNALGALLMDAGSRAAVLAKNGDGSPVVDVLRGGDRVSARTARCEAARVGAAARLPVLAAGVECGRVTVEEFDVVAGAVEDLSDEQLARFDQTGIAEGVKFFV